MSRNDIISLWHLGCILLKTAAIYRCCHRRINFSRVEWRGKGVYRQPGNLSSRVKTDSGSGLHYEHDRAHQPDTVRAFSCYGSRVRHAACLAVSG